MPAVEVMWRDGDQLRKFMLPEHYAQFVTFTTPGCWLWKGGKDSDGYGIYRVPGVGTQWRAHRFIFALTHNEQMPEYVCHTCDTPACVHPEHLFAGDAKANHDDMNHKGRGPSRRNPTKLDAEKVRMIRAYEGLKDRRSVALSFGISASHVWKIWKRETWAWLP